MTNRLMMSVAAAAHSAPGAAYSALPIALLLIPALSVDIRRQGRPRRHFLQSYYGH